MPAFNSYEKISLSTYGNAEEQKAVFYVPQGTFMRAI
jgi:hypothetical protein